MILEVETDAWELDLAFDTNVLQLLWVADARTLEDKGGAEGAARDNNLLSGTNNLFLFLVLVQQLHGYCAKSGGSPILDDDFIDFGVAHEVEIAVVPAVC